MSEQNGWHPWLRPMKMRESSKSVARIVRTKLQSWLRGETLLYGLMLIVLVAVLTGCAGISSPSSEPARNPSLPPTTLSEHSETYSSSASTNIQAWRNLLTALLPK